MHAAQTRAESRSANANVCRGGRAVEKERHGGSGGTVVTMRMENDARKFTNERTKENTQTACGHTQPSLLPFLPGERSRRTTLTTYSDVQSYVSAIIGIMNRDIEAPAIPDLVVFADSFLRGGHTHTYTDTHAGREHIAACASQRDAPQSTPKHPAESAPIVFDRQ